MRKPIIRTSEVEQDIADLGLYIAEDNLEAADRFFDAVASGIDSLGRLPTIGVRYKTKVSKLKGLRKLTVPGFKNHLIFYVETAEFIKVVRVLHIARDIPNVLRRNK